MTPDDRQALLAWKAEAARRAGLDPIAAAEARRNQQQAAIIGRARVMTENDVAAELDSIEMRQQSDSPLPPQRMTRFAAGGGTNNP